MPLAPGKAPGLRLRGWVSIGRFGAPRSCPADNIDSVRSFFDLPLLSGALAVAMCLAGCAVREIRVPVTSAHGVPERGSYIDLQPGWRLSVITPLLKSGKLLLNSKAEQTPASGNGSALSVSMSAGSDFLGYERSFYMLHTRRNGVQVRFSSAEVVRDGKSETQKRPAIALFRFPRSTRHVRLIYLIRSSPADHNMAIVGATNLGELQSLTTDVQTDPAGGCRSRPERVCQWIPAGIAVRPEM